MRLYEALEGVKRIFIDTAPVIYFVEENRDFVDVVQVVIDKLIAGEIEAVISPVTLAECMVQPIQRKDIKLQEDFVDFLLAGEPIRSPTSPRSRGSVCVPHLLEKCCRFFA